MQNLQSRLAASDAAPVSSQSSPSVEKYSVRQRLLSASLTLAMTGSASATAALANGAVPTNTPTGWLPQVPGHTAPGSAANTFAAAMQSVAATHASNSLGAINHAAGAAAAGALRGTNHSFTSFSNAAGLHGTHAAFSNAALSQAYHAAKNVAGALATQANGSSDLNLASANPIFAANSLAGFHAITLDIGGKQQQISLDSKLTAAELVAAQQVLSTGKQELIINSKGVATGGYFDLSSSTVSALDSAVGGNLNSLVISRGVQAVDSLSSLNLTGTLINLGSLTVGALPTATNQATDLISATNIFNGFGGTIASASVLSSLSPTSIALTASDTFFNNGLVSSAGNLNITAPNIINTFVGASTAQHVPTLSAAQNVNITTQNLTNAGLISAASGNVNIVNGGGNNNIAVTGTGGTIQALNGNINFNQADYAGTGNVTLSGGDYLSKQVNFNVGSGAIEADVDQVSGVINGTAGSSHITTATDNMNLGNICVSGDPTYYNTAGNITISGNLTGSPDLALLASGNIIAASANGVGGLDTSGGVNGGNILLVAGATLTGVSGNNSGKSATSPVTITGASKTGGFVDLSGNTFVVGSNTSAVNTFNASGTTGKGGDITIVAFKGTAANSGSVVATRDPVQTSGTDTITSTGGAGGGTVTILANGANILLQNVDAGALNIYGATPSVSTGGVTVGTTGAITSGTITPGLASKTAIFSTGANGTATSNLNVTGDVNITTGSNYVEVANVTAGGKFTANTNGLILVDGIAQASSVNLKSTGSFIEAASIITAGAGGVAGVDAGNGNGVGGGGNGGDIALNGTGVFVNYLDSSGGGGAGGNADGQAGGKGGNAGNITLTASNDNIQIIPLKDGSGKIVPGQINASGGGGGGGAGALNGAGGAGGSGGNAGTVQITTPFSFIGAVQTTVSKVVTTNQSIVAFNGGAGGAGGTGAGTGSGGGGGGGSYGGAGGGGAAIGSGAVTSIGGGGGGGTAGGGGGGGGNGVSNATGGGGGSSTGSAGASTAGTGGTGTPAGSDGTNNTAGTTAGSGGNGGGYTSGSAGLGGVYGLGGAGGTSTAGSTTTGADGFQAITAGGTGTVLIAVGDKIGTATSPVVIDTANLSVTSTSKTASIYLGSFADATNLSKVVVGASSTFSMSVPFGTLTIGANAGDYGVVGGTLVALSGANGVVIDKGVSATTINVSSPNNVDTTNTSGDISGAGTLTAKTVNLFSETGIITANTAATNVSANAGGLTVTINEAVSAGKLTNILASSTADGGVFTVNSAQQLNITGVILDPAGIVNLNESGTTPIGINITAPMNVGVTAGTVNLTTTGSGSIINSKAITATNININANGAVGSSSRPFLTNTLGNLKVTEATSSLVYIKDSNAVGFTLNGTGAPGSGISVISAAKNLNVNNLVFSTVTLQDTFAKTGSSTLTFNANNLATNQIGDGTGVVTITTANANIEAPNTSNNGFFGTNVVLKSTAGSVGGGSTLKVTSPLLTATATKGSVHVSDTVATTLAAGGALNVYTVAAPSLIVNGAITGPTINLTSNGSLAGLFLNANVGTASSTAVNLTSSVGITQNAKAVTSGGTINFIDTSLFTGIGTSAQSIVTKASSLITISGSNGLGVYISQNGKATLGSSLIPNGLLSFTDASALTISGAVNVGSLIITAPSLNVPASVVVNSANLTVTSPVVTVAGTLKGNTSATFLSTAGLSITGDGTISTNNFGTLTLGGTVGTKSTTSITLGDKTGSHNPLLASLFGVEDTINIFTTGNFSSTLLNNNTLSTNSAGGTINFQAKDFVLVNSPAPGLPISFQAGGTAGSTDGTINLNFTGTQAVTLGQNTGDFNLTAAASTSAGVGHITVKAAGNLTVDSTVGLGLKNGSTLSLTSAKALVVNADILAGGAAPTLASLTLGSGSTSPFTIALTLAPGKSLLNGTLGNINATSVTIDAAGTITTGNPNTIQAANATFSNSKGVLTMVGTSTSDIKATNSLTLTAKSGIMLGDKTGANNPLDSLLGANKVLTNFTVNTGGNFTSSIPDFQLSEAGNGGTLSITAGNIVTLGANALGPIILSANGNAGSNAGSVTLNLTGTQALVLSNVASAKAPATYEISANGNVQTGTVVVSSGGALSVLAGGLTTGSQIGTLSLSGSKGLAVTAAGLLPSNPGNLTLNSGATSALQIGATAVAAGGNGIVGSLNGTNVVVKDLGGITIASGFGVTASSLVEFDTKSFTNNGSVTTSANGTLLFGSLIAPLPSLVVAGAGTYSSNIANLSINATGAVDTSTLFSQLTGLNGVDVVTAGTLTFAPTTPTVTVGSGGTINITAGALATKSTTSPILFVDSGVGTINISSKAALTVGTAKGDINFGGNVTTSAVNLTSTGGVLTLTSDNSKSAIQYGSSVLTGTSVIANTEVTAFGGLSVFATSTSGAITTNGNNTFLNAGSTGLLTLGTANTKLAKNPTAVSANGTIQLGTALYKGALNILNEGSSSASIATTAGNSIAALNYTSTQLGVNVGNITTTAGGATITVQTSNNVDLTVNANAVISTKGGGINLISNTPGAALSQINIGNGAQLLTSSGSILLQDSNTTSGKISLGTGVTMHASGTAAGIGQVSMVIGALPTSKQLVAGGPPIGTAPIYITSGGATITFASTALPRGTIISAGAGNILNAAGRNVVFSGGKASGTTITLAGNDTIIADPPVGASSSTLVLPAATGASSFMGGLTPVSGTASTLSSAATTPSTSTSTATATSTTNFNNTNLSNLSALNSASAFAAGSAILSNAMSVLEAPIVTAEVKTVDTDLQTASTDSSSAIKPLQGGIVKNARGSAPAESTRSLTGAVSNVAEKQLDRGVMLFCPEVNTRVRCGNATIDVAADSLALLIAFDGGVAAYNMHDTKRDAVVITNGSHRLVVAPGRSGIITSRNVHYFEDVNPMETVGYRRVAAKAYEDGFKTFQAEFNLFSVMQGLPPLKAMVKSSDARERKISASMLKTAAILLSMSDASPFVLMPARRVTAMAAPQAGPASAPRAAEVAR
ncbi:MAG: hypothetical protein KGS72_15865 [Cyanobacteria bacterium REEB67]|nr:hypothetical protein [Cyanobacteria bacterium REEB67]